ncbi:MAG: hypothetical protein MJ237_03560 [bacterium]|nr:hypothetical protein [bacterium]
MNGAGASGSTYSRFGGFDGFDFAQNTTNRSRTSGTRQNSKEDLDITKTLNVTAKEIFDKKPISVTYTLMDKCGYCNGGGYCSHCGGTGIVSEQKTVNVKLPKEVTKGSKVRLKGEGKTGINGKKGDLYLVINFKDSEYEIDGPNLTKDIEITPPEAVLGCSKKIKTLHGDINIKIPVDVSSGQSLRLKGLGLQTSNGFGDLNAKIKIVVPKNYTNEIKELYKKIQLLSKE